MSGIVFTCYFPFEIKSKCNYSLKTCFMKCVIPPAWIYKKKGKSVKSVKNYYAYTQSFFNRKDKFLSSLIFFFSNISRKKVSISLNDVDSHFFMSKLVFQYEILTFHTIPDVYIILCTRQRLCDLFGNMEKFFGKFLFFLQYCLCLPHGFLIIMVIINVEYIILCAFLFGSLPGVCKIFCPG